ncbi:hypothetical protein ACIQW5_09345 [Methylorubrum thiocyanatum]|jgi:phosphatidylserine/phosphatidylglycerophosphate/cardiolipin synthase-like enzyme|uniref:hypothetical protein n=1 Tax=Methylorubrum thiocyanatum TaxID=47958 RepID=UPI003839FF9B
MADKKFNPRRPWLPRQIAHRELQAYSEGAHVLSASPYCAQKVGEIIGAWSFAENELVQCLGYLISSEQGVASDLYGEIRKIRVRIAVMRRIILDKLGRDFSKETDHIFKDLLEFSILRDQIAHGVFIWPQNLPDSIARVEGFGLNSKIYLYDKNTIDCLASEMKIRCNRVTDLKWILMSIWNTARFENGRMTFPQPEPNLYAHLTQQRKDLDQERINDPT